MESMGEDQIFKFLKLFRPLECSCCDTVLAFQHKASGALFCADHNPDNGSAPCYKQASASAAASPVPKKSAIVGCRNKVVIGKLNIAQAGKGDPDPADAFAEIDAAATVTLPRNAASPLVNGIGRSEPSLATEKPHSQSVSCVDGKAEVDPPPPVPAPVPTTVPLLELTLAQKVVPIPKIKTEGAASPQPPKNVEEKTSFDTPLPRFWKDSVYSSNLTQNESVKVAFVWSPVSFVVNANKDEDQSQCLQTLLASYVPKTKPMSLAPEVGQMVVANYSGEYFRGRVSKVRGGECQVVFVDFGDKIKCKHSEVFPVNDEIMKHPIYGMTICLDEVPPELKTGKLTGKLEDDVYANNFILKFRRIYDNYNPLEEPYEVTLIDKSSGSSLNAMIKEALCPTIAIVPESSKYTWSKCRYSPKLVHNAMVNVHFPYSLTTYHIVADEDSDVLIKFQQVINEYIKTAKPMTESPVCNQIVITTYDNDAYRGRVEKVEGNSCDILFIDFGDRKTCKISDLFPVNDTIMERPVYGMMVHLYKVPDPPSIFEAGEHVQNIINEPLLLDLQCLNNGKLELTEESSIIEVRLWDSTRSETLNEAVISAIKKARK